MTDEQPIVIEQVMWFEDRIVFEIVREDGDEDLVEWTQTLQVIGRVDNHRFQQLTSQMHQIARAMAFKEDAGKDTGRGRRRRRWRKNRVGSVP